MALPTRPPAADLMRRFGLEPDDWQLQVLDATHPRLLLNCCRQAGKSTTVAVLALATAMNAPLQKVLIVAPSLRQSSELFRLVTDFYDRFNRKMHKRKNASELLLGNDSRIICVPCTEHTIRGFSGINLLILDEASRIPEDVYRAVRPTLIASRGRMVCLSTPHGKRGFFYKACTSPDQDWQRIEIPARMISRLSEEDLVQERRALGEQGFRQEYECCFEVVQGLVYPDMQKCLVPDVSASRGGMRKLGGIDFGYRNPFAAIWGHVDIDGILWITHEHYQREQTIDWHAERLPRDVLFICDPHSPDHIKMLCKFNVKARKGNATRRAGIDAVQSRIRNGGLRIVEAACPNLTHEAGLYRWADVGNDEEKEKPDEPENRNNHALDALRYLIMHLGEHGIRYKGPPPDEPDAPPKPEPPKKSIWQKLNEHTGWTYLTGTGDRS